MNPDLPEEAAVRLADRLFDAQQHRLTVPRGEVLLHAGEPNRRLHKLLSGTMKGYSNQMEVFSVLPGEIIGIPSFFSGSYRALFTVVAVSECELAYLERSDVTGHLDGHALEEIFMPLVVRDLVRRNLQMRDLFLEHQAMARKVQEIDKLVSLGQLSAGVAHELNNALAVLASGTRWLSEAVTRLVSSRAPACVQAYRSGLERGRNLSSAEVRQRATALAATYALPPATARKLARLDLPPAVLAGDPRQWAGEVDAWHDCWEYGATLHDMSLAATQSEHVVQSMRALGVRHTERGTGVNVAGTISSAVALLRNRLKGTTLLLDLHPLPPLRANPGELMQVWTNLITNSLDALHAAHTPSPRITISAHALPDGVSVAVHDNGPGIPQDILPTIFQPNVTTKKKGMSFGLGLGLTIVHRLVSEYGGQVTVDTSPQGTTFTVTLPAGAA